MQKKIGEERHLRPFVPAPPDRFSTQGGVLMPNFWTNPRWKSRNSEVRAGSTATWNPKNRVSVAPPTASPPRKERPTVEPIHGTNVAISVPTLVAKNEIVFQGRR